MNEIIERMARVIDPLAFTAWTVPPRGLETAPRHIVDGERMRRQRKAERTARAALLSIREPTSEMVSAAPGHSNIRKTWHAMIDTALADATAFTVNDGASS